MATTERSKELSDQELVVLALKNKDDFYWLVSRYEDKFRRYVRRLTSWPDPEIEDALQDIFLKIFKNLNGYNNKLPFSSWAYRIAHNHVISLHRKKTARPQTVELENNENLELVQEFDLIGSLDQKILAEKVAGVLSKLRPEHQEVLQLKFLEDKTYDELSDILSKPPGTIATLIHKAKKDFKKYWI